MIEVNYDPTPGSPDGPPPTDIPRKETRAEKVAAAIAFVATILLGLLVAAILFGLGGLLLVVTYQELASRLGM